MGFVFLVIILVFVLMVIVLYNSLIRKKNAVGNAFGAIDAMLKKRYDLLPNLVTTVKTYMNYERETLTKITELRNQATTANISQDQKIQLENQIGSAMRSIMVQVENYPDLKANQNFLQLQGSWNEIEEQISAARRAYNASVNDYNNAVEQFPTNMMSRMMNYTLKPYLDIPEEERKNVSAEEMFKG
ncbi:MAG TPA: LemA family protein [Chitinophagales bacterium]|nr:LemA family protein [Chitinophagales bacterium]